MTLNHKVVGSIPTASTKWFFLWSLMRPYMGERQSWRAGADCKSVAFGLSWFKSNLPHHTKVKNGRDMEAIHLQL